MTDAIRAESLTKYFGPVVGVERLALRIHPGEVYGFLGPNGAGKTTTIRLLLDLLRPTSGRAFINGHDTRDQSRTARAQVGYLPAEMPLYPDMTGRAWLRFLARLQARPVDGGWLDTLFARFAVSDADLARRLGTLSHGMNRKLGIIQALMARPAVLILDEPTSGLDPLMIEAFAETVGELKGDGATTIFLSSHVLSEVERLCDRIGIIRRGTLARQTSLEELRAEMPRRVRISFDGRPPVEHAWRGALGPLIDSLDGARITDIDIEPFKLEEYVLGVYAEKEA
jgi:ABC-2 type transport system ATP-binding protein